MEVRLMLGRTGLESGTSSRSTVKLALSWLIILTNKENKIQPCFFPGCFKEVLYPCTLQEKPHSPAKNQDNSEGSLHAAMLYSVNSS